MCFSTNIAISETQRLEEHGLRIGIQDAHATCKYNPPGVNYITHENM